MKQPELAARQFLLACLVGAGLGIVYGFLRPLRRKHGALGDLLFVAAAFWGWLCWGFGICRGDYPGPGILGLGLGCLAWEVTVGRLLRPVFSGFWKIIDKLFQYSLWPAKKILKIMKILFASVEKWVTIGWNQCQHRQKRHGGHDHGNNQRVPQPDPADISAHQQCDQDRGGSGYRYLYGHADRSGCVHPDPEKPH